MLRKLNLIILYISFTSVIISCKDNDPIGKEWGKLEPFPGEKRHSTYAVHGDKCYVFFGKKTNVQGNSIESNDVWSYDIKTNKWHQMETFPFDLQPKGGGRSESLSFTIDDNIYVIGGVGLRLDPDDPITPSYAYFSLNEFLMYDPLGDSWTKLENFPGEPRLGGIVQVFNGKAYYGLGQQHTSPLKDFWTFDPSQNEWTRLPDFPGSLPEFYYSNSGIEGVPSKLVNFLFNYQIILIAGGTPYTPEMWSFNTVTNEWVRIASLNFGDPQAEEFFKMRSSCVNINFKGKGYVIIGEDSNGFSHNRNIYEFDLEASTWRTIGSYPSETSSYVCAFSSSFDDAIIFGTEDGYFKSETWKYRPNK